MANLGTHQTLTTVANPAKLVVGLLAVGTVAGTGIGIAGTLGVQKIKKFINDKKSNKNSVFSETEQPYQSRFGDLLGKYDGKIHIPDDFDEPMEEFKEYR